MAEFWLDSSVFIEGKKGPYAFDLAPRFWEVMDNLIAGGVISCPALVYDELINGADDLAEWAGGRRASGLFVQPDQVVQTSYADVVRYVVQRYPDNQARKRFLNRADPWVIAHALRGGTIAVTLETPNPPNSNRVKIPNVCNQFGVQYATTYDMLRELQVSWTA